MNKINTRSPYFITTTQAGLVTARMELYIYTGLYDTDRGSVIYTIESAGINEIATFEISELVNDFLDIEFDGTYNSQMVWVTYQIFNLDINGDILSGGTQPAINLEGYNGYGYFIEGAQGQNSDINSGDILMSNRIIYRKDDSPIRIPVRASRSFTVGYVKDNKLVHSEFINLQAYSNSRIKYVSNDVINGIDSFKDRVKYYGGIYEKSEALLSLECDIDVYAVDSIYIDGIKVSIKTIQQKLYEPLKVTFVNKYGVLQDLWFFEKNKISLKTKSTDYKSNIVSNGAYNTTSHNDRVLNKNGVESITLNSGLVPEEFNELFRQLILSERVWIEIDTITYPINISSNGLDFLTQDNDKLISYTINADFAFNKINNIR